MKKNKFTSVIMSVMLCLMLCVSLLAGCSLVTKDMNRYYNATVASFKYENGETVNVTKKELITSFNAFGYQYIQSGLSVEEAVKQVIDRVIEQKLTIKAAEKDAKAKNDGEILTAKEKKYLWERTFDAVKNNLISYYNDINGIKDENEEDSSDGVVEETEFSPAAELVKDDGGNFSIKLLKSTQNEVDSYTFKGTVDRDIEKAEDLDELYNWVTKFVEENREYSSAFNKYLSEAKRSEEGMNLSKDNKSVFERELKRIHTVLYENFMVAKYAESHQAQNAPVTLQNLMELYESKLTRGYDKYVTEKAPNYESDVLKGVSSVDYFKPNGTEFFYVSHILAKFSDEDQAKYNEYVKYVKGEANDGKYTAGEAQALIDGLYTNLVFPVREKNKKGQWVDSGKTKPVMEVMKELELKLATAGDDEYLKAEYFNEFIYKYNQDDGVFNSDRNYVIGIDKTTPDNEKDTPYTIHSQMVENFTNAAVALYKDGQAKIGDIYKENEADSASGLIKTEYGIHIMVFEGKVQNLFSNINSNFKLTNADLEKLISKEARLKAGEAKTVFDALYEELNTDRYTIFENMDLQFLKSEVKIEYYRDNYKDLF